jgi:cyclic beta-1,2-glucan synthetase
MYRAGVESILGLHVRAGELEIKPRISPAWQEYELHYQHGTSTYRIKVRNPQGLSSGAVEVRMDGAPLPLGRIPLRDEGRIYVVDVLLKEDAKESSGTSAESEHIFKVNTTKDEDSASRSR